MAAGDDQLLAVIESARALVEAHDGGESKTEVVERMFDVRDQIKTLEIMGAMHRLWEVNNAD